MTLCREVKSEDSDKNLHIHLNQIMSFLHCCAVCTSFKIVIITYTTMLFCCSFRGLVEFSAATACECYVVIKEWENMSRLILLHASIKLSESERERSSVTAHDLASHANENENDKNLFREIWLLWPVHKTYYMAHIGNLWLARTHKLRVPPEEG